VGLGGACSEEQAADPRSWFQISRVVKHVAPFSPHDELAWLLPLFKENLTQTVDLDDVARRYQTLMTNAVIAWREDRASDEDVRLLNWMLASGAVRNDFGDAAPEAPLRKTLLRYREVEQQLQEPVTVNGMADIDERLNYRLNIRGDYDDLGEPVPHGAARFLLDVCGHKPADRTRLELAELVASRRNPLTSRVYVNRVWHWMFGTGLVATPDDFGHVGDQPSHPELLDYLAQRFMDEGWSTKKLIRNILISQTWQQSQQLMAAAADTDPMNRLLHHFPVQRLDAESLRDAMLLVSGRLDTTLYGPRLCETLQQPNRLRTRIS